MTVLLRFLRQPFVLFLTIPAAIIVALGLLPLLLIWLDGILDARNAGAVLSVPSANSARTVLSVVAGGAMTALSLAYSLVLVVFTLAAGTIGPRLLKRFTSEPVNQVTAGLLGGTFVYCIVTLLFVEPDFVPKLTVSFAVVLAVVSVLQLVYFVRQVAQSITIDDEIARISQRLRQQFMDRRQSGTIMEKAADEAGDMTGSAEALLAEATGYVRSYRSEDLIAPAKAADTTLSPLALPGSFVMTGALLVGAGDPVDEEVRDTLGDIIQIEQSRSDPDTVEFSINLLIEIALRALSPGINDTYTAIAVANNLAEAFSELDAETTGARMLCDPDGAQRVLVPALARKHLIGSAFHPLRRAARGNVLMSQALARTYATLHALGDDDTKDIIANHARLLKSDLEACELSDDDIDSALEYLPGSLRG
jgi:uncharacterized membrane protein